MSTFSEFREFIARGNVVDLAVGVIIGGAFGKIVTSLVDQVVMPPIGLLMGGIDFAKMEVVLRPDDPATKANELVAIQYGAFVNTVIQFLIVAWVVFLMVKGVNAVRRAEAREPEPAAPPAPTPSEALLTEIRDLLKTAPAAAAAAPRTVAAKLTPAPAKSASKAAAKPAPKASAKPKT